MKRIYYQLIITLISLIVIACNARSFYRVGKSEQIEDLNILERKVLNNFNQLYSYTNGQIVIECYTYNKYNITLILYPKNTKQNDVHNISTNIKVDALGTVSLQRFDISYDPDMIFFNNMTNSDSTLYQIDLGVEGKVIDKVQFNKTILYDVITSDFYIMSNKESWLYRLSFREGWEDKELKPQNSIIVYTTREFNDVLLLISNKDNCEIKAQNIINKLGIIVNNN